MNMYLKTAVATALLLVCAGCGPEDFSDGNDKKSDMPAEAPGPLAVKGVANSSEVFRLFEISQAAYSPAALSKVLTSSRSAAVASRGAKVTHGCREGGSRSSELLSSSGTQSVTRFTYMSCREYGVTTNGENTVVNTSSKRGSWDHTVRESREKNLRYDYPAFWIEYPQARYVVEDTATMSPYYKAYGSKDFNGSIIGMNRGGDSFAFEGYHRRLEYRVDGNRKNVTYTVSGWWTFGSWNGWERIDTPRPVRFSAYEDVYRCPTEGEVTYSGKNYVISVVFNSDRSVHVDFNGKTVIEYPDCSSAYEAGWWQISEL